MKNDILTWIILIFMILNCVVLTQLNKFNKLQLEFDRNVVEILSEFEIRGDK